MSPGSYGGALEANSFGTVTWRDQNTGRVRERCTLLARSPVVPLDEIVVLLHHQDEPQKVEPFAARREVGVCWLIPHRPEQNVGPFVPAEALAALDELS